MKFRVTLCTLFLGLVALTAAVARGQESSPAPDNTKTNQRDRSDTQPTADQQQQNRSDLELTQKIRKSLVNDRSLSTYAHNVKVIAQHGMVTLKGPVRSDEEKRAVEAKATEVAGESNVTSQLEVVPEK